MTGIKTALPIVVVAFLSVVLMLMLKNNTGLFIDINFTNINIVNLIPYVSMSLVFVIVLTFAMRQALTMYVSSIIALITAAHFYIISEFDIANRTNFIVTDIEPLIFSFIILLPLFALIKIPAHKLFKGLAYLIASLIFWLGLSFVIAKIDLPFNNLIEALFKGIGRTSPFKELWFTPLQLLLLLICGFSLLLLVLKSAHHFYLLSIAALAVILATDTSPLLVISFAIFGSIVCLFTAIITSRNMAFNDELTGIPGRRSLSQYAQEVSQQYVVVMIDIDFFKKFNDQYGHDAGDDVIKLVASKIAKTGNGAKAFRYGGEEFTLIFDGVSIDEVRETVEDLRVQLETYPVKIRNNKRSIKSAANSKNRGKPKIQADTVKVTCSFGISESNAGRKDFKATIKRADAALYKAKKGGRNCVRSVNE